MGAATVSLPGKWYENRSFLRLVKVTGLVGAGFVAGLLLGRRGY